MLPISEPKSTRSESQVLWFEAGVFGNSRQHLWPDLVFVMESEDHIRPTRPEKNLMRTGFALNVPSDAEKGCENAFCFS